VTELWIPITIAAAFLQNARSALQKSLKERLSNTGATYVRFAFGFPIAAVYLGALALYLDEPLPVPDPAFFAYGGLGGLAQILGTATLLHVFSLRSFAVGTAYSKTEPVQTVLFGILLLGEGVAPIAALAIGVSVAGVILLGFARSPSRGGDLWRMFFDRGAGLGLLSGTLFGLAAVCYRAASLSLDTGALEGGGVEFLRAAFTLAGVLGFQAVVMTIDLGIRDPPELRRVLQAWQPSLRVGICGAFASVCWFTAMTFQNAAHVRALGQVELLFALAASWLFFRERILGMELLGILLLLAGILGLVLTL
jgi:drug/metabolite transporter (DMT)-like permease